MRPSTWFWPFPFGVQLSWASTRAPNPEATRGQVFLLRGQGIVFSRGLSELCGVLRRAGIWAEDLRCMGDAWILRHLEDQRRAGQPRRPLIFVGHSCGGRAALFAARELEKIGVPIDLIVCLDVAMPPEVPGNVRRALNLYRTRRRRYPAGALRPAPGSTAQIDNIDLDETGHEGWLHHLNFTDSVAVQAMVLGRIFTVLDEIGEQRKDVA